MSDSTDPSHPDYVWPGGDRAASKNEIANAVAHIKAWIARELAAVGVNLPTAMVAEELPPEPPAEPAPVPSSPPRRKLARSRLRSPTRLRSPQRPPTRTPPVARQPDYLRDRGLADHHEPPQQVVPFVIGADGLPAQPAEGVAVLLSPGMPDDYTARVLALETAARLDLGGYGAVLDAARAYHAFLTATEPAAPAEPKSFTDE